MEHKKENFLGKEYLIQKPSKLEIRFDTLNVIIGKDETEIEHITNAF